MFYAINKKTGLVVSKLSGNNITVDWCENIEFEPNEIQEEILFRWWTIKDWKVIDTEKSLLKKSLEYRKKRASEYPWIWEQLDMIYKDAVNWTTLWKDLINEIKSKYPKN